nr:MULTISPECIES: TetR/AcrR family transcriptional regulator [unclassified Cryobacterium]
MRQAAELGPDAATVAAISAEAGVSARTFFNYFATKDDAILGFHEEQPTDEQLAAFVAGTGELLADLVELARHVLVSSDNEVLQQRRRLLFEHPELFRDRFARMLAIELRIASAVAKRMRASGEYSDASDPGDAAAVLVMIASGVVRLAVRKLLADPSAAPDTDSAIADMLNTLREVTRSLQ